MKKFIKIILFALLFIPSVTLAATFSLGGEQNTFSVGGEMVVPLYLDTGGVSVNAIGGTVSFPGEFLKFNEARDGNSAVNFWVEHPHLSSGGKISFSGITTGGVSGKKLFLFDLVFQSTKEGQGTISLSDIQLLKNDGSGTSVPATSAPYSFNIAGKGSVTSSSALDTEAPENFQPMVGQDGSVFDGKYFLAFSAVDKGSGIDHYEVKESGFLSGLFAKYTVAESPYLLKDQNLQSKIFVKAVDKAGNERIAVIAPKNKVGYFLPGLIIAIILIVFVFIIKKLWPKSIR